MTCQNICPRRCTSALPVLLYLLLALSLFSNPSYAQNAAVTVSVNAQANRRAISPQIYGIAYGSSAVLSDLNIPLNRLGGNNTSRYNWMLNADNRANDYYFESIGDASAVAGERGDTFFSTTRSANAQAMVTIPLLGWIAKLGAGRAKLAGFSVAKYGAQTGTDSQWYPDAGNGVLSSTGLNILGNDPNDANVASNVAYQQGWVQHLISQWGTASNGGLRYYLMDNEPSIWHSTHRDVHPTGATMDEVKNKIIGYASMIKSLDAGAQIVGPEEWGWSGYFYSGYDQQYGGAHGWNNLPDRANHGGADYVPWLLDQLHQSEITTGKRLLDVFSLHYYPQGGEFGNDTSPAMQLRRNRSTRSLWDPNYVDESWINTQVQLIPRMRGWLNTSYPGLKMAITEYNWGAENHINGATTQADILGIFGREGLDMATRWTYPDPSTPTYKAMKLYRNYDDANSGFGDVSVSATVPNSDTLAAFASTRTRDGALTVVVISKVLSGTTPVTLALAGFNSGVAAQAWQLTSADTITRLSDLPVAGSLTTSVPAQSITLFVVPTRLSFDFDGDGHNDMLLQNSQTGRLALWYMNGANVLGGNLLLTVPLAGWNVAGSGDFNADGSPDLVLQNQNTGQVALWYMNNTTYLGGQLTSFAPGSTYKVVGVGDFNNDGKPDLVFQDTVTGKIVIWFMNGAAVTGGVTLPFIPAANFRVVGVGDFNADQKPDLLLQNAVTGQLVVWYMNGSTYAGGTAIATIPGNGWLVKGIADYNNDGMPDIMFQNASTNQAVIWYMNGLTVTGGSLTSFTPAANYLIVGPR